MTGLAQVQLPPDTDIESVRRKIAYDLYYVQHCAPWMDFRLFFATALHVMCLPHEFVGKILGLPRGEPVEEAYRSLVAESRQAAPLEEVPTEAADMPKLEAVPV